LLLPSAPQAPAGGGSGGGGASTGGLAVNLDLTAAGNLWTHGTVTNDPSGVMAVMKYSPNGGPVSATPLEPTANGFQTQPIRFNAAGQPWVGVGEGWASMTSPIVTIHETGNDLAVDAAGNVWILLQTQLKKYTAAGALLATVAVPPAEGYAMTLRINPQGELIVLRSTVEDPTVYTYCQADRLAPDGTVLSSYVRQNPLHSAENAFYYSEMGLDAQGNVWLMSAGDGRLFKLSPTLTELAEAPIYASPLSMSVDPDGKCWVFCTGDPNYLTRYGTDGQPEATAKITPAFVGTFEHFVAGAGGNACWVPMGTHIDKLLL
jgi:hypothetical protein